MKLHLVLNHLLKPYISIQGQLSTSLIKPLLNTKILSWPPANEKQTNKAELFVPSLSLSLAFSSRLVTEMECATVTITTSCQVYFPWSLWLLIFFYSPKQMLGTNTVLHN